MVWELVSAAAVVALEAWAVLEVSAVELDDLDSPCRSNRLCPNPCCTELLVLHWGILRNSRHHPKHSSSIFCLMDQEWVLELAQEESASALALARVLGLGLELVRVLGLGLELARVLGLGLGLARVSGLELANLHNLNLPNKVWNNQCCTNQNFHPMDILHNWKHHQIGCNNILVQPMPMKPTLSKVSHASS